jgi:hypothetical protein
LAPKWKTESKGLSLPATNPGQTHFQSNQNNKAMHSLRSKAALITGSGRAKAIAERFTGPRADSMLTPA